MYMLTDVSDFLDDRTDYVVTTLMKYIYDHESDEIY
jgi:hypothetical protein